MAGEIPNSNKAERACLGCILLDSRTFEIIDSIIDPEDFWQERHRILYEAMGALIDAGTAVDPVTLGEYLIRHQQLEKAGGALYLGELIDAVATSVNADAYANVVRERAAARKVMIAAQKLTEVARSKDLEATARAVEVVAESADLLARSRMPASLLDLGDKVLENYARAAAGFSGVALPWPILNEMTMGMWPGTVTFFVARPGVGKCLRWDTPILDPTDGIYRQIRDVVQQGRAVLSRTNDGSIVPVLPNAFLYTGRKECLSIALASGRTLSGTPEHPVMTTDGWKRLDEIAVGGFVEAMRHVPEPLLPETPPDEEVILIAALLAEGGYTSDAISFTNQDRAIVSLVSHACERHGVELRKTKGMRKCEWKVCWKGEWRGRGPNPVRVLLDKYGCQHKLAKEKEIPDHVFSFSNEKLALFLGVLWGCDGYVDANDTGITLASEQMVRQIQRLLLRFGVLSNVMYKAVRRDGRVFDSWRLRVYSSTLEQFRDSINPIVARKQRALDKLKPSNPNVDNVPMTELLAAKLKGFVSSLSSEERSRRYRAMESALGMTTPFSVSHLYRRRTVSRRTFAAFVDAFEYEDGRSLLRNHWDRVVAISRDGEQDVYDLTVNGTHSFVANDIVAHNTFVAVIAGRHAWLEGNPTLIVSPEMSKEEIAERFFVVDAPVNYDNVVRGTLSAWEMPKLQHAVADRKGGTGLWIMDSEDDLSPKGIEAAIRACKPKLVAIDSIYDLRVRGERRDRALVALEWMRAAAKRFGVPMCAFAQQNRAAELSEKKGGGSRLGTIALADEIGQDAHSVFALEQDKDMRADKQLRFKPLKLRRGRWSGEDVIVNWDFEKMNFTEVPAVAKGKDFKDEEEIPF